MGRDAKSVEKSRLKVLKWLSNTKFGKWRFKRFTNRVRSLCYLSIHKMPIINWWALNEGNLESLYKDEYQELGKGHSFILRKVQNELLNQFFKEFGFDEKRLEILKKQREITLLYLQKSAENNPALLTDIEIAEKELANMTRDSLGEPANIYEISGQIKSILGFNFEVNKCTVSEFYGYMKVIEKKNKK